MIVADLIIFCLIIGIYVVEAFFIYKFVFTKEYYKKEEYEIPLLLWSILVFVAILITLGWLGVWKIIMDWLMTEL